MGEGVEGGGIGGGGRVIFFLYKGMEHCTGDPKGLP